MGLRIRTNVASLNVQRRLGQATDRLQGSMNKLASGRRINIAADDAAGLAISSNLRADIRSLNQARRNALDGVSLVQTAEGGLEETSNMIIRLRELAVQSASDTLGSQERTFLDKEYQQLKLEIDRITNSTEFNGTRLLTGRSELQEDLQSDGSPFPLEIQVSKDYYQEIDALEEGNNPVNIIRIDLQEINSYSSGDGSLQLNESLDGDELSGIAEKGQAQMSIARLDASLTKLNSYRAYLGALQNRFTSTVSNLGVQIENLGTGNSRILDTDYAEETAEYTKQNILQQAATSALSQANSQPKVALGLLQNL